MKVLRQRVQIDQSGKITLNIDSGLSNCEADVLLVIDEASPKATDKKYDFSDIAGKLKFEEDALTFQKKLRDEWE